jgi:PKD repeat protein/lysophospholipase L1-like esterase
MPWISPCLNQPRIKRSVQDRLHYPSVRLFLCTLSSLASVAALVGCSADLIRQADPIANLGGSFTAVAGTEQKFDASLSTDPQSEPLTYAWSFGDGGTATGMHPTHTYAVIGPVVVSLTVIDTSRLSSTVTAKGTITPGTPFANPGGSYAGLACIPVTFSGQRSSDPQGEALLYAWNFGDGSSNGTGVSPSHTYAAPGTYAVSLTLTNSSGLSATATTQAIISARPPGANAGGPYAAAQGTSVNFSGMNSSDPQGEALIYAWNFGDGRSTGTGVNPSHTYAVSGTYAVSLTVTNTSGLSATTTTQAIISARPPGANAGGPYAAAQGTAVNFSGMNSSDPQGEALTYAWNFGDGSSTGSDVNPSHTYVAPGTYTVSLTVTNTSGLSATTTTQAIISARPPGANAGGPYSAAQGTAVSFSGQNSSDPQGEALAYTWNFGDGNLTGSGVNPSHTYLTAGTYTVSLTVTNTSGLSAAATTTATVSPPPPLENWVMAGGQPISNSSVELYATGAGTASAAVPLLKVPVITNQRGGFSIAGLYNCPSPNTQVYLAATGGNPGLSTGSNNAAIALMAALGSCGSFSASQASITIDEISTVAAIWPGYAYQSSISQVGAADPRNMSNSFIDSANLAGIASGASRYPGILIPNQDEAIRSLANSLDTCVRSNGDLSADSPCSQLFATATPAGGSAPTDTLLAALAIALSPRSNVAPIFNLGVSSAPFQPALTAAPADWTLGLPRPTPTTFSSSLNNSTVFMGDSITNFWPLPVNNAGISGQHASQMLERFASDVLGHGYARVVILAGTNDIWFPGVGTDQAVEQIESMAQMARAAGIEPVLCELPPMTSDPDYFNPLDVAFNAALADFAITNGYLLVDYYTPMVGHPEYFVDGVHPNAAGYAVMEAALSAVVQQ